MATVDGVQSQVDGRTLIEALLNAADAPPEEIAAVAALLRAHDPALAQAIANRRPRGDAGGITPAG